MCNFRVIYIFWSTIIILSNTILPYLILKITEYTQKLIKTKW